MPAGNKNKYAPILFLSISKYYINYGKNSIIRISYYFQDSTDSLSSGNMQSTNKHLSIYYYHVFVCNNLIDEFLINPLVRRSFLTIPKHAILGGVGYKKMMNDLNCCYKKILVSLFYFLIKVIIK